MDGSIPKKRPFFCGSIGTPFLTHSPPFVGQFQALDGKDLQRCRPKVPHPWVRQCGAQQTVFEKGALENMEVS